MNTAIATPDEPTDRVVTYDTVKPVVNCCSNCGSHLGRMLAEDVRCPRKGDRNG
jgi:hypothetical protein